MGTHSPGETLLATAAMIAGALLPALAYLRASGAVLRPLGPDLFGYIWQTRIIGHTPLSGIDPRPGVPVLGSVLAGLRVTWDWSAALVLAPVMIVALGFAVAVALRIAFPLPRWTLGVLGFVVSLWGGSIYLAQGHLANLLSLVCIVPAVLLLAIPSGTWMSRMIGATAMATASGLAHAGFLPFYTAAAGLWLLLSIPSLLRARRQGRRWWEEPSCSFVLALLIAAAVVAVVIFGAMGTSVDGFTNIDDGISEYGDRLARITGVVGLWVSRTSVLAFIGIVAARRLAGPRSRALTLLGLAWMMVSLVGGLVALALPSFPGHRALASILPLAALCGLGIVGVALVALGSTTAEATDRRTRIGPLRASLAAFIVISLSVLVVSPNLERLTKRAKRNDKGEVARTIASYVATVDPGGPVVVLVDPSQRMDALSWRGRQNQVRGLAPTASIARIFFLVGQLGEDLMPVQTVAPENAGDPAFVYAVRQSWSTGGAALREDAIILVAQAYVPPEVWDQLVDRPSQIVIPGLAVLRGPLESPTELVATGGLPKGQALWQVLGCILALVLLGGGFGGAVVLERRGSVLDAIAIAPSLGAAVVVLVGVVVALLGWDPAGVGGLFLVGLAAAGGYLLAWRRRRAGDRQRAAASSRELVDYDG